MLIPKSICKELSDAEILRKSMEEVDYFSCLFERYELQLKQYIQRIARMPEAETEDILQDAFIKVWKNLHAIDPEMKLSSWLFRIVHNETISWLRHKTSFGKDKQVEWRESQDGRVQPAPSLETADAGGPDQEQWIKILLDQLPLPYREVLVLRFLEDMSYADISDVLKIPEGTVATRINRAKKAFAELSAKHRLTFEL